MQVGIVYGQDKLANLTTTQIIVGMYSYVGVFYGQAESANIQRAIYTYVDVGRNLLNGGAIKEKGG